MFAVGHLSLGYLFAKASAKLLKQKINLPLIFLLSLIPDVDILIPGVEHRTITHSIITTTAIFIPLFIRYRSKAIPYFAALAQHSLIGDFITGGAQAQGAQLLWPITSTWYGLSISILSQTNIILEWSSFLVAVAIMLKTKDMQKLLKGTLSHLSLSVPTLTVLLPSFLHFPLSVPLELLIPHLAYLILFALSILTVFKSTQRKPFSTRTTSQNSNLCYQSN
ncbi:MAG: metal-dependent hydrolase [Candidatus Bathyarchaeota archaeon]|nr:metal-dependent hydrolase [Candidatus Bathyarchaeota archaeon]